MYTQNIRRQDVPSNYSGNAFRYPPIGSLSTSDTGEQEEGRLTDMDESKASMGEQADDRPEKKDADELHREDVHASSLPTPLSFLGGGAGLGNEELLLLGLFLLLSGGSGNEEGPRNDVLPYLLLLLLFGR